MSDSVSPAEPDCGGALPRTPPARCAKRAKENAAAQAAALSEQRNVDQSPLTSTTPTVSGATTAITARAIGSQPGWRRSAVPN